MLFIKQSQNINKMAIKTYISIVESESKSEVAQSCPTLWDPMDCSLSGSKPFLNPGVILMPFLHKPPTELL